MTSSFPAVIGVGVMVACLGARAQQDLTVVRSLRGPFQHAVVGSSLVQVDGTVLPDASARLRVEGDVELVEAHLFWMGSRVVPDDTVVLTLPSGERRPVTAAASECFVDDNVASTNGAIVDDNYFACNADVTALLSSGNPSGTYAVGDVDFETRGARYCINTNNAASEDFVGVGGRCRYDPERDGGPEPCTAATPQGCNPVVVDDDGAFEDRNVFVDNIYAGGWALLVIFRELENSQPRVLQVARGMVGQQSSQGVQDVLALQNLELAPAGGRLTHVAIGGDRFKFTQQEGEALRLCRGPCTTVGIPLVAQGGGEVIGSVASPAGSLYNESISSEFPDVIGNVTETSGLDLDTYDLSPAFDPNPDNRANNLFAGATTLNLAASTGIDALGHVLVVVEVADLDSDGDGLSNLEEDRVIQNGLLDAGETDPDDPDTDGDGLCDGPVSVFGGGNVTICRGGEDTDRDFDAADVGVRETDPLDPDTDDDGLCDGFNTVLAEDGATVLCFGGENRDGGPVRSEETHPLDPDSDGDGLCDGPIAVADRCEAGEDINGNGLLESNETDPTDPGSTATANCRPGDEDFPVCRSALNPDDDDNDDGAVEERLIAGSSALSCGASGEGSRWGLVMMLALWWAPRRRRSHVAASRPAVGTTR